MHEDPEKLLLHLLVAGIGVTTKWCGVFCLASLLWKIHIVSAAVYVDHMTGSIGSWLLMA